MMVRIVVATNASSQAAKRKVIVGAFIHMHDMLEMHAFDIAYCLLVMEAAEA